MALPSVATEENDSKISEPSSIKPLEAVNLMSDLELSDAPLELADNVKLVFSGQESEVPPDNVIKTASHDLSSAEEVQTLDEISEEIEEDLSEGSKLNTKSNHSSRGKSHRPKDSKKSEQSTYDKTDHTSKSSSHDERRSRKSRSDSRHSRSNSKSKYTSQNISKHSSYTSEKQKKRRSRHSNTESSKHRTNVSLTRSDVSYTTDFSESSRQTETESSKKSSSGPRSAVSSTKVHSIAEMGKERSKVIM
jgi:hypothetical protein